MRRNDYRGAFRSNKDCTTLEACDIFTFTGCRVKKHDESRAESTKQEQQSKHNVRVGNPSGSSIHTKLVVSK